MPNHHTPIVPVDETTITKIQPQHPIDLDIAAWLKAHPGQWIDYPWQDRYPNTSCDNIADSNLSHLTIQ